MSKSTLFFCTTPETVLITGGKNGNLGPVWTSVLEKLCCRVFHLDRPDYDLRDENSILDAKVDCIKTMGLPEIILCNAGVDNPPGSTANLWGNREIMDVNYFGHKYLIQCFWEDLIAEQIKTNCQNPKRIIFIGSLLGNVAADHRNYTPPFDKPVDYGASKQALRALMMNLATRGAKYNILVNMLSFAAIEGNQDDDFKQKYLKNVPMGRMANKLDLENALVGMLIQTYLTGQEVKFFGGYDCW